MKKTVLMILAIVLCVAAPSFSAEFSADVIMEGAQIKNSGKVYFKSPQVTRNEIMGVITIVKHDEMFQVFPQTRKYTVSSMEELKRDNPMAGVGDLKAFFKQHNMKQVGKEKIGNYACDIYEGTLTFEQGHPPVHTKIWYSSELEYPILQETVMPDPMGKMVLRLDNIQKGKQPDELFKVPAGFTRVSNPEEAMGMGMPPMQSDKMPSQEEMMKQIEEMMKNMGKQ